MSDDLVMSTAANTMREAADRIEELEAERDQYAYLYNKSCDDYSALHVHIEELEAKLEKAVEALELIVVDDTWGLEHDVYMKCRAALAELKGETNAD